ncbi:hypothetical protein [Paraflavitalea speifideaquila]|uniref:hypothetical protein n=1 Tax=Paraflavitalea speifideaquila TaxID=3076558 RepID=UPI0028E3BA33|nr:hypothetical protein [Paraflavitalea speifideiaquila]
MADIKRRSLLFLKGKEIKLFGNSLAINKSFQIGEGGTPNILSFTEQQVEVKAKEIPAEGAEAPAKAPPKKTRTTVFNPYGLTEEDLLNWQIFR